jgi:hypothetical protein
MVKQLTEVSKILLSVWIGLIVNFLSINPIYAQTLVKNITISSQFTPNPLTFEGVSHGSISAREIAKIEETATGYCDGFVNHEPNYTLTLNSFFNYLKIEVESPVDTTILVKGPGGIWCNDDSDSTNPSIEGQWQPGNYKIWIGSYQENSVNNYRVKITQAN